MSNLIISNLDPLTLERLNALATIHGQTLESEVKNILQEAAIEIKADAWAAVDSIRNRLAASGRQFSDSVELLREDRNR